MLRRSFLFFQTKTTDRSAHNSPLHLAFQEKLSEQLEEYRNINKQLQKSRDENFTRYLISRFGEADTVKMTSLPTYRQDSTSFENGLKKHRENLSKNMLSILEAIRYECAQPDEDTNIHTISLRKSHD